MNVANAAVIIRHSIASVAASGVGMSLIEILKTVQHRPSLINRNGTSAFVPQFNASEISVEEITHDKEIITRVSFLYAGEKYDFVSKIDDVSSTDQTHGNITLHENGDWVINIDIVKNKGHEQFAFKDLNAFRHGAWMENILGIALEIESHKNQITFVDDQVD